MAKIENQSGLVLGTNLFLHIQEVDDTDITVTATSDTITQSAGDFTATSSVGGIEGSGFADGDRIHVVSDDGAADFIADISGAPSALSMSYVYVSGTEADVSSGTRVNIQRVAKYIEYQEAGGLSFVDGVAATALHSKMQTLWKDSDLDKYDPLSGSIEPRGKSLYFLNGWDWYNNSSRDSHRGGAVQVQDTKASAIKKIYGHITAPATVDSTDQWTFWYRGDAADSAPNNAVMTGYLDQLVLIYDSDNSIDLRGYWIVRCAEQYKSIAMQQIRLDYAETVGVTESNAIDPVLYKNGSPVSDATIGAGGIYANIDITKNEDVAVARTTDGADGNVAIVKTGANITVTGLSGGSASEKATGTITLSALPADGDTITIDDGINTAVVFEFDNNSSITGDYAVTIGADTKTTLTALMHAINDATLDGVLAIVAGQGVHSHTVQGIAYNFGHLIEYDSQDYVTVHEKVNYLSRQTGNVNQDGTGPYLRGDKMWPISVFVGSNQTLDGVSTNDSHESNDQNNIDFLDQSDTTRKWNTIASYTIVVPQSFIDASPPPQITIYEAASHGSSTATVIQDTTPADVKDRVLSQAETSISFAHSTYGDTEIAIAFNQPGVAEAEVFFGNTILANTTQRFQLAPSVDPSYVA